MNLEDVGVFFLAMVICFAVAIILSLTKKGWDSERAKKDKTAKSTLQPKNVEVTNEGAL